MFLDDYIKELQVLRDKYGNVEVMKETHPYPDDWDDNDDLENASKPRFAQISCGSVFNVDPDIEYRLKRAEVVILI